MTRRTFLVLLPLAGLVLACSSPQPAPRKRPQASPAPQASPRSQQQSSAAAGAANLTLANETDLDLILVYASFSGDNAWGDDLLQGQVVPPGETTTLVLKPGTWDLRCVTSDGGEILFAGVEMDADDYVLTLQPDEEGADKPDDGHADEQGH